MEFIKRHPYLFGTLILLVVLFFILRGRKSASAAQSAAPVSPTATPQYALAALQSGTQLQQSQIAATVAKNQTNAQLAATQVAKATELQEAQLARDTAIQNIVTSGQVQTHSADLSLEAIRAQTGAQVQVADIGAQRDVQLATISTQGQLGLAETAAKVQENITNAQVEQSRIAGATQLGIAQSAADVQKTLADYQFQTEYAKTWAGADVAKAQIQSQTDIAGAQAAVAAKGIDAQLAAILGQQGVESTYITTSGDVAKSSIAATATTNQSIIDLFKSGQFNKGGEGGQNQAQIFSSIFGSTPVPGAKPGGFSFGIPGVFSFGSNQPAPYVGNQQPSFLSSLFG